MRPEKFVFQNGVPVKAFVRSVAQYPFHWHQTLEIMKVLKGKVCVDAGDHNLILCENDIVVINVEEIHRIIKTPGEDNKILFIQIDSDFYQNLIPENDFVFLYCCSVYHEKVSALKYIRLKEYVIQLTSALLENSFADNKQNVVDILTAMLEYMIIHFDYLRWGYGTTPFEDKIVYRLKQIAKHAISDIDAQMKLKELAFESGISLQHLSYDIRRKFGFTFVELLNYGRCIAA